MALTLPSENDGMFSLSKLQSMLLKDKDPTDYAFPEVFRFAPQILFSNNIPEFDELVKAIVNFDEQWASVHKKYHALGLNWLDAAGFMFYEQHPEYSFPDDTASKKVDVSVARTLEVSKSINSPDSYTEFILEHSPGVEFDTTDPHQWRHTDDPVIIGHCYHKLLSVSVAGYPPELKYAKEAVDVAQKLFEQATRPVDKRFDESGRANIRIIDRAMAIKVAIYVEDLPAALDILKLGIRLDRFQQSQPSFNDYLQVPGIYKVLPLLAAEGLEANPWYLSPEQAKNIVATLKAAMESRITNGQSLPMGKISWQDLLNRLAKAAWEVNGKNYKKKGLSSYKDILFLPATKEEIADVEKVIGKLPNDFKEMLRVSNGFKGGWHFLEGGMSGISDISVGSEIAEWVDLMDADIRDDGEATGNTIEIAPGAESDGYVHHMILPATWKKNVVDRKVKGGEYLYFPVADWDDSRETYSSVRDYVQSCVQELENMVTNGQEVEDEDKNDDGGHNGDKAGYRDEPRDEDDVPGESQAKRQRV